MEKLRTYDISFDQIRAKDLFLDQNFSEKEKLSSYIVSQMETHLGERYNVSLSKYEYQIRDGQMWGRDMNEPFIESLKRGRDYRRKNGNPVDFLREEAEVVGFEKIENELLDIKTPVGTMMLSISPRGSEESTYQHNFYDVFTVKKNHEGKRFIEARRYTSALGTNDYKEKLSIFTERKFEDNAADFLANPIKITGVLTPDDVHKYLHQEHKSMDESSFAVIKEVCRRRIEEYSRSIIEQPDNEHLHKMIFNTILNKADEIVDRIEKDGGKMFLSYELNTDLRTDINRYAFREVKTVTTGCGISGGYETAKQETGSPFTVSDYGKDKYGERTFNCPSCKKENVRPYNALLPRCQHCNSTEVAC